MIRDLFPLACASDTEGSSNDDAAEVSALGNMIRGKAIPEKIPYTDNASEEESPLAISFAGN